MSEHIQEKVGHLSPKIVIPVFIVILLTLGAGLFYAYNPDNFKVAADYARSKTTEYIPKAGSYVGIETEEETLFGAKVVPEQPIPIGEQATFLPDISRAVAVIYPTQDDKSRNNPGTPPVYVGKAIEIDLSSQRMFVWENGQLLYNWATSTGRPDKPTKKGNFKILSKMRWAYGSGEGDTWAMPYWMGFYFSGGTENGIHGLPLINGRKEGAGSLGTPVSHGCVRVADSNIEWLYSWAEIGTPVIVHK